LIIREGELGLLIPNGDMEAGFWGWCEQHQERVLISLWQWMEREAKEKSKYEFVVVYW